MSHEPLKDLQRTMARAVALTRSLPLAEQQAVAAGVASFLDPFLEGRTHAATGLYWAAATESAKAWPSIYELQQRLSTCWHEAAHACCCALFKIPFKYASVSIPAGMNWTGVVMLEKAPPTHRLTGWQGRQEAQQWAVMELAGPIAQQIAGYAVDPDIQRRHDKTAERHLLRFAPLPMPLAAWLQACREETTHLLRAHWPSVQRLSDALATEGTVAYGQAVQLLKQDTIARTLDALDPSPLTTTET
jgi:hypothetical protein